MERFMSIDDVAQVFSHTPRWVKDTLVKTRAIEYTKVGASYFFTERAVKDCIARKTVRSHKRAW